MPLDRLFQWCLIVTCAVGTSACSARRHGLDPTSDIIFPQPKAAKVLRAGEDGALKYRDVEAEGRDPFLLLAEEKPDAKPEELEPAPAAKQRHSRTAASTHPYVLKQLHETVTTIIIGPRN